MTADLETRRRDLTFPKAYLDSDALVKGMIESRKEVEESERFRRQDAVARNEIRAARKALDSWNPDKLVTSYYGITEAIRTACRPDGYGLDVATATAWITGEIGTAYTIISSEFEIVASRSATVAQIEDRIEGSWKHGKRTITSESRDKAGNLVGTVRDTVTSVSGSSPIITRYGPLEALKNPELVETIKSATINEPKFERELFLRAVDVALEYNIALKDAFHVLIGRKRTPIFVTTDAALIEALKAKGGFVSVLTPSGLLNWQRIPVESTEP